MSKVLYVSPYKDQWKVNWEDSDASVVFTEKENAVSYAMQRVASNLPGYCRQIKLMGHDGDLETIWEYEKDHYPPRS